MDPFKACQIRLGFETISLFTQTRSEELESVTGRILLELEKVLETEDSLVVKTALGMHFKDIKRLLKERSEATALVKKGDCEQLIRSVCNGMVRAFRSV